MSAIHHWKVLVLAGAVVVFAVCGRLVAENSPEAKTAGPGTQENFVAVDRTAILQNLDQLPVQSWNYKGESPNVKHIGPKMEDFRRFFGFGDGVSLAGVDVDGILLIAVQELNSRVRQQEDTVNKQRDQLDDLQRQINQLKSDMQRLNSGR